MYLQVWVDDHWAGLSGSLLGKTSHTVPYYDIFDDVGVSKYRIAVQIGTGWDIKYYYSNEFTVTWTEDSSPFAFTTQPVGGPAKKTDGYTFNWNVNQTPDDMYLQVWIDDHWAGLSGSLLGKTSHTVPYYDTFDDAGVSKYRIAVQIGTGWDIEYYYSNEFTVTWTEDAPTTYTVTIVSPITNGSVTPDKSSAAEGETVSLTVVPDDGYELDELIVKDEGTNLITLTGTSFKMPAANVNVEATFKLKAVTPITYTVTIATPTNGSVIADKLSAAEGETVSLTVVPDDGYELDALIVKDEGTNLIPLTGTSFKMPAANVNVEATFKLKAVTPITYTVTFDANGHGTAPTAQNVESGKTATKPADPSEAGWTFKGWYKEADCINAFDFATPITGNVTLYAKWTENSGGQDVSPQTGDNSHLGLWIALMAVSLIGLGGVTVFRKDRKRRYKHISAR